MISPPTFSFLQPWSQQNRGSSHLPELCTSGRTAMVLQGCGTSFPCTTGKPAQESASSRTLDGTQPPLYCGFFGSEAKNLFQSIRLNWLKGWQNMSLSTLLNPTGQITFPIKFHPSYSVRVIFLFIPLPNLAASESKQILYLVACWQARGCSFWCNVK